MKFKLKFGAWRIFTQKRNTKSASQTVAPPATPLPEPELNRQTQQSSRSTRHQAGLDFRPRDSRSEPHSPALKTSRAALVAHAAGARAPTGGETRARERRTPGERPTARRVVALEGWSRRRSATARRPEGHSPRQRRILSMTSSAGEN